MTSARERSIGLMSALLIVDLLAIAGNAYLLASGEGNWANVVTGCALVVCGVVLLVQTVRWWRR